MEQVARRSLSAKTSSGGVDEERAVVSMTATCLTESRIALNQDL